VYDELLPKPIGPYFIRTGDIVAVFLGDEISQEFKQVVREMEGASVIAGRADAAKVTKLSDLVFSLSYASSRDDETVRVGSYLQASLQASAKDCEIKPTRLAAHCLT